MGIPSSLPSVVVTGAGIVWRTAMERNGPQMPDMTQTTAGQSAQRCLPGVV